MSEVEGILITSGPTFSFTDAEGEPQRMKVNLPDSAVLVTDRCPNTVLSTVEKNCMQASKLY